VTLGCTTCSSSGGIMSVFGNPCLLHCMINSLVPACGCKDSRGGGGEEEEEEEGPFCDRRGRELRARKRDRNPAPTPASSPHSCQRRGPHPPPPHSPHARPLSISCPSRSAASVAGAFRSRSPNPPHPAPGLSRHPLSGGPRRSAGLTSLPFCCPLRFLRLGLFPRFPAARFAFRV
jgi:hypothetical protein